MKSQLIVALDVATFSEAKKLIDRLYPAVKIFKVGSQLFTACGPKAISYIRKTGGDVFLDLKFHDIPNTVALAVSAATAQDVFMLTVHASGGPEMLRAARRAAEEASQKKGVRRPRIVAVTVLTSETSGDVTERVTALAETARQSGADGVVASVRECGVLRARFARDFIVVTPGIRPEGPASDDQKRTATVAEAVSAGSDFLVVGRPIVKAPDPVAAAKKMVKEIKASGD